MLGRVPNPSLVPCGPCGLPLLPVGPRCFPWAPVASRGLPLLPVGFRCFPWAPVASRGPPLLPFVARALWPPVASRCRLSIRGPPVAPRSEKNKFASWVTKKEKNCLVGENRSETQFSLVSDLGGVRSKRTNLPRGKKRVASWGKIAPKPNFP